MHTDGHRSLHSPSCVGRRNFIKSAAGALGTSLTVGAHAAVSSTQLPPEIHGFIEDGIVKRTLGRTGLKVSAIGLGTIPTFRAPKKQAVEVIKKSYDSDITYIDTARAYRNGYSEECIGEALKGVRHNVVIASKTKKFNSAEATEKDIDISLKALQTDYIDIYCLHELCQEEEWKKATGPKGELEGLKKAQKAGKIRFIGISGHRSDQLTEIAKTGEMDVIIIPYNYVFNDADDDLWPVCRELNIGMVGIKPFAGCFLNQHSLSLRYNLQKPLHVSVPGMWQVDEVIENSRHLREFLPLNETELSYLREERQYWYYQLCRFCYQCKPCPESIKYRSIVMMPLMLRRQGFELQLVERKMKFKYLNNMDKVEQCTNCGYCVETCKYHLPIPEIMREVKRNYYNPVKYYRI